MENDQKGAKRSEVSRRDFIQGIGIVAGAVAMPLAVGSASAATLPSFVWQSDEWKGRFIAQLTNYVYQENYEDDDENAKKYYPLKQAKLKANKLNDHRDWVTLLKADGASDSSNIDRALSIMWPSGPVKQRNDLAKSLFDVSKNIPHDIWELAAYALSEHFESHKKEKAAMDVKVTNEPDVRCW